MKISIKRLKQLIKEEIENSAEEVIELDEAVTAASDTASRPPAPKPSQPNPRLTKGVSGGEARQQQIAHGQKLRQSEFSPKERGIITTIQRQLVQAAQATEIDQGGPILTTLKNLSAALAKAGYPGQEEESSP